MRLVASFALGLMLPTALMASGPSVVEQLRHDLVGKTFTLASDVAGDTCLSIEGLGAPTSRLVDTEITEDAESRFYLRDTGFKFHICPYSAGTIGNANFSGASGMYIGRNLITNMHSSGSLVVVKLAKVTARQNNQPGMGTTQ